MIVDNTEENRLVNEFQKQVKELEQTDATLKRFLRARNHDISKAEEMLRKSLEWRAVHNIDDALNWEIDEIFPKEFPIEYPGVDNNNRSIMYIPVGIWNVRDMIEKGYREQMRQYIYVVLENMVLNIEKHGEQMTVIVDMDGMTYYKLAHYETVQMTLKVFREFEASYPERLAQALLINTPLVINYIWPLIKPLLTGNTLQKVKFLGSNPEKYFNTILESLPASSLPNKLSELFKIKGNSKS